MELDAIAARIAELKTLEPTPALERELATMEAPSQNERPQLTPETGRYFSHEAACLESFVSAY